jgi:hypothetical protein
MHSKTARHKQLEGEQNMGGGGPCMLRGSLGPGLGKGAFSKLNCPLLLLLLLRALGRVEKSTALCPTCCSLLPPLPISLHPLHPLRGCNSYISSCSSSSRLNNPALAPQACLHLAQGGLSNVSLLHLMPATAGLRSDANSQLWQALALPFYDAVTRPNSLAL